jgi:hypothetical protein
MAAQHCRIQKIVWTYIYCLAIIKGQHLATQLRSTKEGNKYWKQIKYCNNISLQRQKNSKCWNKPQHKTQCLCEQPSDINNQAFTYNTRNL